jgi:hypothetical protein
MTPTAAIQMRHTTTFCYKLMTVLRASRDNEVKITIKSFQHLMHTKCCL